jgi:hypothetical protein
MVAEAEFRKIPAPGRSRSNLKRFWLLFAAILLVGAVAVAVVLVTTGDPSTLEALAPGPDAAPSPPVVQSLSSITQPPAGPAPPQLPVAPNQYDPPAPTPPEDSWEAVPPTARAASMGPVGGAVGRGLNELKDLVGACFDEDVQARHGLTRFTQTLDHAPMPDNGTTVLMLQIETRAGGARIVDAPLETRGGASDGLVACAQRVLRGRTFEVPDATAGGRYRLLYPLLP